MVTSKAANIDEYILNFPREIQILMEQIRMTIKDAAPDSTEKISYGIPTFVFHGNLIHFAAYNKHIGFYPGPNGIEKFQKELSGYKCSKGAVQFPLDKPLPLDLISKIVKFRVKENLKKAENSKK